MSPLFIVAISVFLEILCLGAILPVLHLYTKQLGGDAVWIGILFALMSGPKVFTNPFWGWLSDRWGRKPVLILVTAGCVLGSLCWAFADDLTWLTVSRLLSGLFGSQAVLAFAIAADTSKPEKRAASMGILGAAFSVGISFGPLLGGWIGEHLSYAAVGTWCAMLESLSLLIILFVLPETRIQRVVKEKFVLYDVRRFSGLGHRREVMILIVITLLVSLALSEMTSCYGLTTESWYGFNAKQTAYAFALFGIIGALVQGGLVRIIVNKSSERISTFWGLLILAAGFFLVSVHAPLYSFWMATALIAVGSALTMPALTGLLSRCVNEHEQGWILGINQGATGLGRAGGAMLAGGLFKWAKGAPYWSAGAIVVVSILILLLIQSEPEIGNQPTHPL